jgi:hypothetical protein
MRIGTLCILLAANACVTGNLARAQAVESADGPGKSLWIGGEYSNSVASFPYQNTYRLTEIGAFTDYRFSGHIGAEVETHFSLLNGFHNESERDSLAGLQYRGGRFGRVQTFGQFLVGVGQIQYPFHIGSGSYLALAPSGGATYRLDRRWALRGEFEYQIWAGSPNLANEPAHELRPYGFHLGVTFRLRR